MPDPRARPEVPPYVAAPRTTNAWAGLPLPLRTLVYGFVPAVLLGWFFPFRVMGEGMSFLVHELGHTAVSWLFGRLAVPAVIMTITFDQSRLAAATIWLVIAYAAWRYRAAPRWRIFFFASALLYPVFAFTPLHVDLLNVGGHLAEVGLAAFFFHRAVAGDLFREWERPVWAFFGWYLWFRNAKLFFGVATDAAARTDYLTVAIAGENDLVKVASAHGLGLPSLAFATFVVAAVVPAVALVLAYRRFRETQSS